MSTMTSELHECPRCKKAVEPEESLDKLRCPACGTSWDRGTVSSRPHYSASALGQYMRCGAQRGYVLTVGPVAPGIRQTEGSVLHGVASETLRHKRDTGSEMPVCDVRDMAADAVDTAWHGEIREVAEELADLGATSIKTAKDKVKDRVVRLSDFHARWVVPNARPVLVEELIDVDVPGVSWALRGIIDEAEEDDWIEDLKSKRTMPKSGEAEHSLQLGVYALLFRARMKRGPAGVRYRYLCLGNEMVPSMMVDEGHRTRDDAVRLLRRFHVAHEAISRGIFPPADPDSWICRPSRCGYYGTVCQWVPKL